MLRYIQSSIHVEWPSGLTNMMNAIKVIDINVVNIPGLSLSCIQPTDMYLSFLAAIATPAVIGAFLAATAALSSRLLQRKAGRGALGQLYERQLWLRNKLLTGLLWLILLIYPTVSRNIFQVRRHCSS
jgi:hypothetical protein